MTARVQIDIAEADELLRRYRAAANTLRDASSDLRSTCVRSGLTDMVSHPALRQLLLDAGALENAAADLDTDASDLALRLELMRPLAARDGDDTSYTGVAIADLAESVRGEPVDELFELLDGNDAEAAEDAIDALVAYGALDPDIAIRLALAVDPEVLRDRVREIGAERNDLAGDELAAYDETTWDPYAAYFRTLSNVDRESPHGERAEEVLTVVFRLDEPPDPRSYLSDHPARLLTDALGLGDWGGWFEQQVLRYTDDRHDAHQQIGGKGDPIAALELAALGGLFEDGTDTLDLLESKVSPNDETDGPLAYLHRLHDTHGDGIDDLLADGLDGALLPADDTATRTRQKDLVVEIERDIALGERTYDLGDGANTSISRAIATFDPGMDEITDSSLRTDDVADIVATLGTTPEALSYLYGGVNLANAHDVMVLAAGEPMGASPESTAFAGEIGNRIDGFGAGLDRLNTPIDPSMWEQIGGTIVAEAFAYATNVVPGLGTAFTVAEMALDLDIVAIIEDVTVGTLFPDEAPTMTSEQYDELVASSGEVDDDGVSVISNLQVAALNAVLERGGIDVPAALAPWAADGVVAPPVPVDFVDPASGRVDEAAFAAARTEFAGAYYDVFGIDRATGRMSPDGQRIMTDGRHVYGALADGLGERSLTG
ncbi:MAG: hypothetical protein S0880_13240 [Actinomycetota bacterium]|nr:hypothetical protein [Actinomycetota bacterium]